MDYLTIITTSGNELTVGAVTHDIHVIQVALLFEDIGLRLPAPDKQLTQTAASKRQQFSTRADCNT